MTVVVDASMVLSALIDSGPEGTWAAHEDLLALRIEYFPYYPFAERIWELRNNVTAYDAWYVALAEQLAAPLATLDQRLATATGPSCTFTTPPPT